MQRVGAALAGNERVQPPAWAQHAGSLGEHGTRVRDVLENVKEHDRVGRRAREREPRDVAAHQPRAGARGARHGPLADVNADDSQIGTVALRRAEERSAAAAELHDGPAHVGEVLEAVPQSQRTERRRIERELRLAPHLGLVVERASERHRRGPRRGHRCARRG